MTRRIRNALILDDHLPSEIVTLSGTTRRGKKRGRSTGSRAAKHARVIDTCVESWRIRKFFRTIQPTVSDKEEMRTIDPSLSRFSFSEKSALLETA